MRFPPRMTPGTARATAAGLALLMSSLLAATARAGESTAPTVEQVIAKARAALGTEQKLSGVMTLKITGIILDEKGAPAGSVVLMFQKPKSQRIEIRTSAGATVVRASDGVGGWALLTDKDNQRRLKIYRSPELEDLIFSGIENLYFYRGTQKIIGAEVVLNGAVDYQGAKCWKVTFLYPRDITFVRYFDQATGELRGTLTPGGIDIREVGKMTVDGINFPASVQNYDKDGKLLQTLKISTVEINRPMDSALFATPSPVDLLTSGEKITVQGGSSAQPGATRLTPSGTPLPPQLTPVKPLSLPNLAPLPGNTTTPAENK